MKQGMLNELMIETEKEGVKITANKTKFMTINTEKVHIELLD